MAGKRESCRLGGELVRFGSAKGLSGRAGEVAAEGVPANTERAYRGHIARYGAWCRERSAEPWAVLAVADYLAWCLDQNNGPVALRQCASALRYAWKVTGRALDDTPWRAVLSGAAVVHAERTRGRPVDAGQALALRLDALHVAVRALYEVQGVSRPRSLRDRALLLVGYLGAMRRTDITRLDRGDVREVGEGLVVAIRGVKGDRATVHEVALLAGERDESGRPLDPAVCPVEAWRDWCSCLPPSLGLEGDPAWLGTGRSGRIADPPRRLGGDRSVERILQRALADAGVRQAGCYTAHSLRAGLATELAERGVPLPAIATAGRWKALNTVLRYARRGRRFKDSPLRALGY